MAFLQRQLRQSVPFAEGKDRVRKTIVLEEDDDEEDEFIPRILDIYEDFENVSSTETYWVEQHMGYVFLPKSSPGNIRNYIVGESTVAGATVPGNVEIAEIYKTGDAVAISSFPDRVILCPELVTDDTPWRASLDRISYVDPTNPENDDFLLEDVMPKSAMMLHELAHLVTAWRLDENGQRDMVGDVTCESNLGPR